VCEGSGQRPHPFTSPPLTLPVKPLSGLTSRFAGYPSTFGTATNIWVRIAGCPSTFGTGTNIWVKNRRLSLHIWNRNEYLGQVSPALPPHLEQQRIFGSRIAGSPSTFGTATNIWVKYRRLALHIWNSNEYLGQVFVTFWVQVSIRRPVIATEILCGFLPSLQANVGPGPYYR
jgi:hypothetical protein